jgi:hypothetical protein
MVETFTTLTLLSIAALVIFRIWFKRKQAAHAGSPAEIARLQHHEAWLRERLARAEREHWGEAMIGELVADLEETTQALTRATASSK